MQPHARLDPARGAAARPLRAAVVPAPGGDPIGRRRLDVHMHALAELGADVRYAQPFEFRAERLTGKRIYLDEPSVTGTENAIMASVTADGETVLVNAASEPHVQDLCHFLVSLGARIEGIGSNTLRIKGVRELGGGTWRICPDHVEVGSFIGCAAVTGGDVTIDECRPDDLVSILPAFERLGITSRSAGRASAFRPARSWWSARTSARMIPKIEDGPWPAFPADLTSIALIVATQAKGEILIFEKMFESRLFFVDKLSQHGRARHPVRPAPRCRRRARRSCTGRGWTAPTSAPAWAMLIAALCAEGSRDREHPLDRPRATSGWTSGCGRSARRSRGWRREHAARWRA